MVRAMVRADPDASQSSGRTEQSHMQSEGIALLEVREGSSQNAKFLATTDP